jgi:hypothetical protein
MLIDAFLLGNDDILDCLRRRLVSDQRSPEKEEKDGGIERNRDARKCHNGSNADGPIPENKQHTYASKLGKAGSPPGSVLSEGSTS